MRMLFLLTIVALLAACGGGREGAAIAACERALSEKVGQDKAFTLDKGALRASAKAEGADQIKIEGTVTFDPGLPREVKQKMECTTRFAQGKAEPDVISFALIW